MRQPQKISLTRGTPSQLHEMRNPYNPFFLGSLAVKLPCLGGSEYALSGIVGKGGVAC